VGEAGDEVGSRTPPSISQEGRRLRGVGTNVRLGRPGGLGGERTRLAMSGLGEGDVIRGLTRAALGLRARARAE